MRNPKSSLDGLVRAAAFQRLTISTQGLDQRFTEEASTFTQQVLEQAISQVIRADRCVNWELARRFKAVWVNDSTQIALPAELNDLWSGTGGGSKSGGIQACIAQGGPDGRPELRGNSRETAARSSCR